MPSEPPARPVAPPLPPAPLSFIIREPDGREWLAMDNRPLAEMRQDYAPAVVVGVVGNPLEVKP